MNGQICEAPAARLAQPFDALAEPRLKGLRFSGHPYRLSGTAQIRDPITLVCIPVLWYDDCQVKMLRPVTGSRRSLAIKEIDETPQKHPSPFL